MWRLGGGGEKRILGGRRPLGRYSMIAETPQSRRRLGRPRKAGPDGPASEAVTIKVPPAFTGVFKEWVQDENYNHQRLFMTSWFAFALLSHEGRKAWFRRLDRWAAAGYCR